MKLDKDLYDTLNLMPGISGNVDLLIKDYENQIKIPGEFNNHTSFYFQIYALGAINVMNPDSHFNKEYKHAK